MMIPAAMLGSLLALISGAEAPGSKTLWLVQPLYPGQEMLVARGEEALARLMAGPIQSDQLIGTKSLVGFLKNKKPDLGCLAGNVVCADPADALIASLGLERVVLIKGGQEATGYRFKVTSYRPATGETAFAEGMDKGLDQALLAAMVKVVPLASSIEIASTPLGATVFIDGEKVGQTPFSGQVLPGDRVVKLEYPSYLALEKKLSVQVRGELKLSETLEKLPARLVVLAAPAGTSIDVDGKREGVEKIDKPLLPGKHRVSLACSGYLPLEEDVEVQPGATFTLERTLQPTTWTSVRAALNRSQEDIYSRRSYFQLNFEVANMWGDALYAQENPLKSLQEGGILARRLIGSGDMTGFSAEFGRDGRYFGLLTIGAGYYRSSSPWHFSLENTDVASEGEGQLTMVVIRGLQPHARVALWRFVVMAQAGLEARVMVLSPTDTSPNRNDLIVLGWQATGQLGLRFHVFEGAYLEGIYRHSWTPFQDTAAFQGFHGGIGYAF